MIYSVRGNLILMDVGYAVVECGGVGYRVQTSITTQKQLKLNTETMLYTYMNVREDAMELFGFATKGELSTFKMLIGITGVGPKVALAALSCYSPEQLAELIAAQDVAAVQRIPGIGKKTASRIILELKGSLDQGLDGLFADSASAASSAMASAREALLSMGFTGAEVELSLKGAPEDAAETALIQYALKKLGS